MMRIGQDGLERDAAKIYELGWNGDVACGTLVTRLVI